jgi:hypothetical protein
VLEDFVHKDIRAESILVATVVLVTGCDWLKLAIDCVVGCVVHDVLLFFPFLIYFCLS